MLGRWALQGKQVEQDEEDQGCFGEDGSESGIGWFGSF